MGFLQSLAHREYSVSCGVLLAVAGIIVNRKIANIIEGFRAYRMLEHPSPHGSS